MKVVLTIPEYIVSQARKDLSEWFKIHLTRKQFQSLLNKNPELAIDLANSGIDTVAREHLVDTIVRKTGAGDSWPMFGQGTFVFEAFVKDFVKKAKKKGIKTGSVEEYIND